MALMLLELRFEALEQREGVGCRAGESRQHVVVIDPAHLARGRLDDNVAERHLAVAAERHGAVAAHRKYRGAVKDFHGVTWVPTRNRSGVATARRESRSRVRTTPTS